MKSICDKCGKHIEPKDRIALRFSGYTENNSKHTLGSYTLCAWCASGICSVISGVENKALTYLQGGNNGDNTTKK